MWRFTSIQRLDARRATPHSRVVLARTATLLSLLLPAPAWAMVRIASDGNASVSELEVLVEQDAWTVRARLDGSASRIAMLMPVPGDAVKAKLVGPEVLDEIEFNTAPRIRIFEAEDPCAGETAIGAPGTRPSASFWPPRTAQAPRDFTVEVIDPRRAAQLEKLLPGLTLDAASARTLTRAVRDGSRLVVLKGPVPRKLRGFWTPVVRATANSKVLSVGLAAPHITVGKALRIELFAAGDLSPVGERVDLPSGINIPEVTFEDPLDLYGATAIQTIRRQGEGTLVRIFQGNVEGRQMTRHFLTVGRRDERLTVELEKRPSSPFSAEWNIRRVWRRPITCDAAARYLNNVRIQQKTEIQTYAALTGRPQKVIQDLQRTRGYLLENGALKPVKVRTPTPVQLDTP